MSKTKSDDALPAVIDEPVSSPAGEAAVFLDQLYTSRTLILPDGRAVSVAKGCITATDDVLRDYLTKHSDFKPAE